MVLSSRNYEGYTMIVDGELQTFEKRNAERAKCLAKRFAEENSRINYEENRDSGARAAIKCRRHGL